MKVRAKERYFDRQKDAYIEKGVEFDVEEKRADVLVRAGVCEIITDKPEKQLKKEKKEKKDAEAK